MQDFVESQVIITTITFNSHVISLYDRYVIAIVLFLDLCSLILKLCCKIHSCLQIPMLIFD